MPFTVNSICINTNWHQTQWHEYHLASNTVAFIPIGRDLDEERGERKASALEEGRLQRLEESVRGNGAEARALLDAERALREDQVRELRRSGAVTRSEVTVAGKELSQRVERESMSRQQAHAKLTGA